jgi:hypothetical protein
VYHLFQRTNSELGGFSIFVSYRFEKFQIWFSVSEQSNEHLLNLWKKRNQKLSIHEFFKA